MTVKITEIRLQIVKKNVAMASFYCLVGKIRKKIVFYVVIRREKTPDLCCFLSAKNITFLCRFVIKY